MRQDHNNRLRALRKSLEKADPGFKRHRDILAAIAAEEARGYVIKNAVEPTKQQWSAINNFMQARGFAGEPPLSANEIKEHFPEIDPLTVHYVLYYGVSTSFVMTEVAYEVYEWRF
jgi:hypothetical protein